MELIYQGWQDHRKKIIILAIVFLIFWLGAHLNRPEESMSLFSPEADLDMAFEIETSQVETSQSTTIYVEILGAVKLPGVYQLDQGARLLDLVDLAGGLTDTAYRRSINQAQVLQDQMSIYVYSQDEIEDMDKLNQDLRGFDLANPNQVTETSLVNINAADLSQLQTLPGIGPAKAQAIIDYRLEHGSFQSLEAIQEVSGIGAKTFEKLKDLISLD